MSITDELRKTADDIASTAVPCGASPDYIGVRRKIDAIADRIDAAHEHGMEERADRYSELRAEMSNCYIELPKDADGEYIRIGDEMEGVDKYDSLKEVRGKVITVSFESDGTVDVAIQAWNSDGKSWHRAYLDPNASVYRHHHAPTVEDVLREFGIDWEHESDCEDRAALLKEYAAKLRLAEREDA